jgi:hypothetical protein
METNKLLKNKVINYSLIEEKEKGVELLENELKKYKYYSFYKVIDDIKYKIEIYKGGIFSRLYYYKINSINKQIKTDIAGRHSSYTFNKKIFIKSFTNLKDLVNFSKEFNNNYIILVKKYFYVCEDYPERIYYNKYNVELLVDYNKKMEKYKILSDKNKEIKKLNSEIDKEIMKILS